MSFEPVVTTAVQAINKAIIYKGGRVGVGILMRDGTIIQGFNVESRGYPIIHAEVVGVLSALKMGYRKNDFALMVIACNFKGVVPACASCRQFLWEHTHPDLKIVAFDIEKGKGEVYNLRDLYPLPFPPEVVNGLELVEDVAKQTEKKEIKTTKKKVRGKQDVKIKDK